MIEIFQDAEGGWRFRVKGNNGEIVAASESYTRRSDAVRGSNALRNIITNLPVEPVSEPEEVETDTLPEGDSE